MALNYANKRLDKYFDALFVIGRMGNSEEELATMSTALSAEDYAELKKFDTLHKNVIKLVSRDEGDFIGQKEFAFLEEYEKTADQINIAPRYKAKMYDNILIGVDKFAPSSSHALSLISKIVDNLPLKSSDDLCRWQKVSERYKYGSQRLYEDLNKKIKLKINGKKPADIEHANKRFKKIEAELKLNSTDEKKIALFEELLELADKCGFKRLQKFQTKANICDRLANLYSYTMDTCKQDYYKKECLYYQKLVKNIYDHTRK